MNNIKDNFSCPCCQALTISELGTYEICSICGWEDDPIQSADPAYSGGANKLSLIEARSSWINQAKDF